MATEWRLRGPDFSAKSTPREAPESVHASDSVKYNEYGSSMPHRMDIELSPQHNITVICLNGYGSVLTAVIHDVAKNKPVHCAGR